MRIKSEMCANLIKIEPTTQTSAGGMLCTVEYREKAQRDWMSQMAVLLLLPANNC